jgi:hypothetical protein
MGTIAGKALDRAVDAALAAVDDYAMGTSGVQKAAAGIARRLKDLGIDYAIVGAIALDVYGFRRLTEDVDVLITRDGLARFKDEWLGRGYVEVFPGGKAVRDTEHNVRIDFLVAGEYPGDGKPKPVAFPEPGDVVVAGERHRTISLKALIELKLASGMTAPHRMRDLDDVMRLIRANGLPSAFVEELTPYVRDKFAELWELAQIDEDY